MKRNKVMTLLLTGALLMSALTGCGADSSTQASAEKGQEAPGQQAEDEVQDLEVWYCNIGYKGVEKGGAVYNMYKDMFGVGIISPYVEWNGGTTYQEQLNLRIAAGEMPDIFEPVNGMEIDLAKNGALLDLTDLLPEKAPHLWEAIPKEVWDVMKSYDPNKEGRIYFIPGVIDYPQMGAIVRQDWLDALNLEMPSTQEEFVEMLRAFKTKDPNGNGIADEIPTGGRAEARWMDYLFSMYGVAMWEGYPQWDIYDGELTYSGVTQNMKDALAFCRDLYAEGLMDVETLLNDKAAWDGKIHSGLVGVYYHWASSSYEYAQSIEANTGVKADLALMPVISAPGYEGYYTEEKVRGVNYVVANTDDEKKIEAIMKTLDAYGDPANLEAFYMGVEGMHCEKTDKGMRKLPDDKATQENLVFQPINQIATVDNYVRILESAKTDELAWAYDRAISNMQEISKYGRQIAGDGIPNSIYEGYADIMNRTLYVEYASKIISGEWDIDKFDEFVEKWYASGGEQVTQTAREWYAGTQK